ncbi:MAG: PIN domain-containing protein [Desulfosarcina sp.]|nr:PIN domain-containing protein [Desulfosarcina sp.]
MKQGVILDTGPLVAFLNRRDNFHQWALDQWAKIAPPMLTCEAVVSEACFLLRSTQKGADSVMQMIERKVISIPFRLDDGLLSVKKLLSKYHSVPMSLADACLVRMSEIEQNCQVFTMDSDFKLYHRLGRRVIPTIMP